MKSKFTHFEVIDRYNAKHRYECSKYHFEWKFKPGTDERCSDLLDVFSGDPEELDVDYCLVTTFASPALVGYVTEDTTLSHQHRELVDVICTRCGNRQQARD